MKLYQYKCPECDRVMDEREGVRHRDGSIAVKCRFCSHVERLTPPDSGAHAP